MPIERRWFAHAHIRTTISMFGKLFSSVYHSHLSADGATVEKLSRVPIRYVPESRSHFQKRESDPEDLNRFIETYPRIAYTFTGLSYDSSRQVSMHQKFRNPKDATQIGYSNAPYILSFDLRILARDNIKACEVLEQILPFFRPNLNVSIRNSSYKELDHDIMVTLDSVSQEDNIEDNEMRVVQYMLSFSVQTNLQGVVTNSDIEITKFDGIVDEGSGPPPGTPLYEIVNGTIRTVILELHDLDVPSGTESTPIDTAIIGEPLP